MIILIVTNSTVMRTSITDSHVRLRLQINLSIVSLMLFHIFIKAWLIGHNRLYNRFTRVLNTLI